MNRNIVLRKIAGVLQGCWASSGAPASSSIALTRPSLLATVGVFFAVVLPFLVVAALSFVLAHLGHAHAGLALATGPAVLDYKAINDGIEKLGRTFAEFKQANEERWKQ